VPAEAQASCPTHLLAASQGLEGYCGWRHRVLTQSSLRRGDIRASPRAKSTNPGQGGTTLRVLWIPQKRDLLGQPQRLPK